MKIKVYEVTLKSGAEIIRVTLPAYSHFGAQQVAAHAQKAPLSAVQGSRIVKPKVKP